MRVLLAASFLLVGTAPVLAEEAAIVLAHHGRLLNGVDQPVSGQVHMKFGLYKNPRPPESSADTTWWVGNEVPVVVSSGMYQVMIGQFSSGTGDLPVSAFEGAGERWLGITIDGSPLLPRLLVGSSPYSYFAQWAAQSKAADALGSGCVGCVTTAQVADGAITLAKLKADGTGKVAGLGADTLDGLDSADFAAKAHNHDDRYLRQDVGGALTSPLTLPGAPTEALHAATKGYVDAVEAQLGGFVKRDGSLPLTGPLTLAGAPASDLHAANKAYVDAVDGKLGLYLRRDGTTSLTGPLTLSGAPTADAHAANKGYVDTQLGNYVRKTGGGTVDLGSGGKLVIGGVTLDEALLAKLKDLAEPVAQTQADARRSCVAIKASAPFSRDGVYWIDPTGGDTGDAVQVYCDQTTDGGGWTLVSRVILGTAATAATQVGTLPVLPTQSTFGKLSDAMIAAIRATSDYSGTTDIRMKCEFSSPITQYVSSACSFGANNVVDTTPNCGKVSSAYEGSITNIACNEGTRGFGSHCTTGWFAYQSTHYNSQGCHADQFNGTNNGNASGNMWVK